MRTYLLRRWRGKTDDTPQTPPLSRSSPTPPGSRDPFGRSSSPRRSLYLWWLAVLTFDLAFIWHLYIKNEAAEEYIEQRLHSTDRPELESTV